MASSSLHPSSPSPGFVRGETDVLDRIYAAREKRAKTDSLRENAEITRYLHSLYLEAAAFSTNDARTAARNPTRSIDAMSTLDGEGSID